MFKSEKQRGWEILDDKNVSALALHVSSRGCDTAVWQKPGTCLPCRSSSLSPENSLGFGSSDSELGFRNVDEDYILYHYFHKVQVLIKTF